MNRIRWKCVKPLLIGIDSYEFENNYKFPTEFCKTAAKYNGGRPSKCVFTTSIPLKHGAAVTKRVMKSLLSFNFSGEDIIWDYCNDCGDDYIAFAIDISDNLICFNRNDDSVVLMDRESGQVEYVAGNFVEFLKMLK